MNVISVVSSKGGVGKTTTAANLSVALHELGHPVLAIDLDPQNSLRFHFSFETGTGRGLVHSAGAGLQDLIQSTPAGVALVPYGQFDEPQRLAFESLLMGNADWLARQLVELTLADDAVVVLDTPPGASVYMTQALTAATYALAVVLPDAGSYVTLPQLKGLFEAYCIGRPGFHDFGMVINQVDQSKKLNRDVMSMLRAALAERVIGRIHEDQSISEALAFGQTVLHYAPCSEGAADVRACAKWISERLALTGALQ